MKQLSNQVLARLQTNMQEPDLLGTRYSLLRFLGAGGMGSVWLAEDTLLQRRVALKVLDLVPPAGDLAERLLQEGRILARLEHPGIVPVHDAGTLSDGRTFFCMKYVEGQTLAQYSPGKRLHEKLRLLQRIAEPVAFAQARGLIHRDLKPENIMIGAFGEVLVMDWGLAKLGPAAPLYDNKTARPGGSGNMASPITGRGRVLGTPGYMSPEQERGDSALDHRSDIFSLGAVLWFLLTGSPPGGQSESDSCVPRPLRAICEKAMAPDPDARYQSVEEMAADIALYLDGAPVAAYQESLLERTSRLYARHRTAVVLVATYLLMRLLFILFTR